MTQAVPERVAAPLRQQVITLISDAIASGIYQPGERLVERELCERYQVSRTVVREALRHLEAVGLVALVPNRGPVVATVSPQEAAWLYEVRAHLEALASQCFAERASAAERTAIVAALENVVRHSAGSEMPTLLAAKDEFYSVMFEGAHNPMIGSLLKTLNVRIRFLRTISLGATGRASQTVSELRATVDAMVAGDGARAYELAKYHVDQAGAVVLDRLAASEPEVTAGGALQ